MGTKVELWAGPADGHRVEAEADETDELIVPCAFKGLISFHQYRRTRDPYRFEYVPAQASEETGGRL